MRELTEQQHEAVQRRRGSLLLAAGAGSGKTSVLVERFVAAVHEDGIAPSRILAITFTERAAGELRERVRARLLALGDRDAARDTEAAHVGTIHGFCARLLRTHALAAGLDPRIAVLDEARAVRVRALAFRRALGELVSGPHATAAVDLVAAYGVNRLESAILATHDGLRSQGERRPKLPPVVVPPSPLLGDAAAALARTIPEAASELDAEHARRPGRRVMDALASLDRASAVLDQARGAPPEGRGSPPLPAALADLALPAANGALAGPGCGAYRDALAALVRASADHHAAAACLLLGELLEAYDAAYAALKRERGVLDFDDLELEARELLRNDAGVRESWSERFALLMVDELQDTNRRQLDILRALERDNLFTVGDEFQSIYGFRHADAELFRARRRALAERGASLELSYNFRGRPQLLDVVNAVFVPRFGEDFTPLVAGRPPLDARSPAGEDPLVELLITDTRGWDADESGDPDRTLPRATSWRQAEARLLAQRLADMVATESFKAGQMAVLVRAAGDVPVYARALEERGLPVLAAGTGGYWSAQQVSDLLSYLAALANPLDEQALYATLACPLVGVSPDVLALIAEAGRELAVGPWAALSRAFPAAAAAPDDEGAGLRERLSTQDRERLAAFCPRLAAERSAAPRRSIAELLVRAVRDSGYEQWVLGLRWGERRLANVHKLIALARAFEAEEGRDLRGFLQHAASQAGGPAREAEAAVEDAHVDAVRLLTVHAAKGLEFDVVAVADLGRQGRTDVPDLLVDGPRVGLRLVALDGSGSTPALDFVDLRDRRLAAEAREEERILYVAMTRARERLLLSGAANVERWPAPRPGAPPLSWLGPALVEDLPAQLVAERPVQDLSPPGAPGVRVRCWLSAPATLGSVLRGESLRAFVPAGSLAPPARAERAIEQPAPIAPPALRPPPTLSYTTLAEYQRCGYRFYLERVLGLSPREPLGAGLARGAGEGLDARVRGTLVHRLLETVDFADPQPPPVERVLQVAGELGAVPDQQDCGRVADLVAAVAGTEVGARLAGAARVQREHPFAFSLDADGPVFVGVVDAIAHELDGGCLIVDYKSDQVGDGDLAARTEQDYGVQRRLYALAALRAGALEVEIVHWFLERPRDPVSTRYEAVDAERLADELRSLADGITSQRFAVSPSPHRDLCLTCPGRRGLCSWDESKTLRPAP